MKNLKRAAVAAAAVMAMTANTLAVPVSATTTPEWNSNGGQSSVHGDAEVYEASIEVELPGEIVFGVNPMKLNVSEDPDNPETSQILSGSYLITNFSEVPVDVSVSTVIKANDKLSVVTGSGTSWTAVTWDTTNPKELKTVDGKKAVLLVQKYPQTIDNDGNMTIEKQVFSGESSGAKPNALKGDILSTSAPAKPVSFVLNAFDESKANESMGGFEFDGAVDPKASFTEDDIVLESTFTMSILTDAQKEKNYTDHTMTGGLKANSSTMFKTVKEKK